MRNLFKIKSVCLAVCMLAATFSFTACDEDHPTVLPAFAGFRLTPSVWTAGDSVTVTAVQSKLGNLIYKAEYRWTVSVPSADTTFSKTVQVVYDNDKADPSFGFRIPADVTGTASISFSADYNYSSATAPTEVPGPVNGTGGLIGNFGGFTSSTLFGKCSGSASTTIKAAGE